MSDPVRPTNEPDTGGTGSELSTTGTGEPTPEPKSRSPLKRIVMGLVAAGVVVLAFAFGQDFFDKADQIEAGACVVRDGENGITEADCAAEGALKVLKKLENTTSQLGCPPGSTLAFSQQERSESFVLCLAPAT